MKISSGRQSALDWYVFMVFLAGVGAFAAALVLDPVENWPLVALLALITCVCEWGAVRLQRGHVSLATVGIVLAALLVGWSGAVIAAAVMGAASWLRLSRGDYRKLRFNTGQYVLAASAAVAGGAVIRTTAGEASAWVLVPAGAIAALAEFAVSPVLVARAIALASGRGFRAIYRENMAWLVPYHVVFGLFGGGLAVAYESLGPSALAFGVLPLLLNRYSIKQVADQSRAHIDQLERSNTQLQQAYVQIRDMSREVESAYTGTLETLVTALDIRDQETRGHSVRVAQHSLEVAQSLGFTDPDELALIYRGALMHDIGKIGVPDGVLLKPGKLTDEEWVIMRKHAAMGYKILAQVPYLRTTAQIVLAHHERWDGEGYPRRLKAENIPIGARIFALSDTYDAIISDRPYRPGRTPEEAFAEILRCAGSQFDPKVVEVFESLFPAWKVEDHLKRPRPIHLQRRGGHDDELLGRLAS